MYALFITLLKITIPRLAYEQEILSACSLSLLDLSSVLSGIITALNIILLLLTHLTYNLCSSCSIFLTFSLYHRTTTQLFAVSYRPQRQVHPIHYLLHICPSTSLLRFSQTTVAKKSAKWPKCSIFTRTPINKYYFYIV